jgi:fido (protein-threonine AMPylation protein)
VPIFLYSAIILCYNICVGGYKLSNFDEYKKLGEPDKREKSEIWETAIGLQDVDGLKPSAYLIENAKAHIDGNITIDEVKARLESYYKTQSERTEAEERTEEADKVSARIAEILAEKAFTFSPAELITIHKRLFDGILDGIMTTAKAVELRTYNISKDEWVLNGDTVYYASADSIKATLDYDFSTEKAFDYSKLSKEDTVKHIAKFISGIWQLHPFGEGNTRTTAVFTIKYLRKFGFNVNNDLFANNSWYFRNALVRANYVLVDNGIHATMEYLNRFFGNLVLKQSNALKNREMQIKVGTVNILVGTVNGTVFDLIKANNTITASEISEQLGISLRTAKRKIKELKESGYIERIGSDKTGSWEIIKEDKE